MAGQNFAQTAVLNHIFVFVPSVIIDNECTYIKSEKLKLKVRLFYLYLILLSWCGCRWFELVAWWSRKTEKGREGSVVDWREREDYRGNCRKDDREKRNGGQDMNNRLGQGHMAEILNRRCVLAVALSLFRLLYEV